MPVAPVTSYSAGRVQREGGSQGSTVGFEMTDLHRNMGHDDPLAALLVRNAFTAVGDSLIRFRNGTYQSNFSFGMSSLNGDAGAIDLRQRSNVRYFQRPDGPAGRYDPTRTSLGGVSMRASIDKIGGRHWLWGVNAGADSPEFETNELGRLNDSSDIPTGAFTWRKTWQPVTLDHWTGTTAAPGPHFTSVMTWQIESFTDVGGNKDQEFVRFIDLPSRTTQTFELAINGPQQLLREHGWRTVAAMDVSRTPWDYRAFIHRSRAEFGVAKHTYVATRSGWFSDRTECYLASGRPALVQDTGWTAHLPHGDGLLAFSTPEEALAGFDRINGDYDRHARCAADIAREHFDARRILRALLDEVCS